MFREKEILYFDYNATTPIDERVLNVMLPFLTHRFANPSSTHYIGNTIRESVNIARTQVADLISAKDNEILFTSGSTEAINIALKGVAEKYLDKGKHIITVSTEHKAVLETCNYLEDRGFEVTYLPVNNEGLINLDSLKANLRADTILVSVMLVNNETGVIHPIKEIAEVVHHSGAFFMTDATQAVGKIEINVDDLGVDLLCISGHKMYAPKGIGALYVRDILKLPIYTHGGGQENNLRGGTLNVPGIIALGKACEIAKQEMKQDEARIKKLRDNLEVELLKLSGAFVNGSIDKRLFNVSNICFPNIDASVLIGRMKNVAVSNGSACNSAIEQPSHVLTSMGLSNEDAFASIRFSLGKYNTEDEIKSVIQTIKKLLSN